mmetsp:Transcript_8799/g.11199  ORF Transcript_8799/g.11199 Transcript_8799/m.11199 type:complete len:180 (-) Transcript_8799:185-724(-)|eukprot:CAMPEP_0185773102 /NCGR_PEP_ID=MMETSP1174-20130828/72295_1 /TAXON_ID=35687 /ORGANISM="Dictyocha speculum, Strain CCMP1381" /LENGTH=179 /DNA_ID=CAMNT_0028459651 /DNA_START=43 /DNA_END=582 /DNA_ORIENTATION=+
MNWLCRMAKIITAGGSIGEISSCDLLELYCGNGNHTVALAGLFRRVLAVEIDPTLCEAAEQNLKLNTIDNASVFQSPSHSFCQKVLRRKQWTDKKTGRDFSFGSVLVDPPRSGLDKTTRELVSGYQHVLYISCNPLVSLRRDLDHFKTQGLHIRQMALLDHFPFTSHLECAVYLNKDMA